MSTTKKIVVTSGDGIGPDVSEQAVQVMQAVALRFDLQLELSEHPVGGIAYDLTGTPLPDETLDACKAADAILLGAVGGPKWEPLDFSVRPERGLLKLRSELQLYANLRPAVIYGDLVDASTLKREVVEGTNIMVIRELTGGIYFGQPRGVTTENGERTGRNTLVYSESEIQRIAKVGFETAQKRSNRLTSVDKANVLETTELWRNVVVELSRDYPDVELNHMYVDNAAMQLIRDPKQFDTVVTTNLFGDILSDAAAMLTGSIGMLPSASVGGDIGLYEPVHGSAPDIAGQDKANPLATILSVGMMFRYSFDLTEADELIQKAVVQTIETHRTGDIMSEGKTLVGCQQMGDLVLKALESL
ncbi:MAG: 3-isopropylmalate dehydrogenase [Deltaproteobacteria bacterium]|jgi:3-isopropylmalate dehydrogenase|nr:3-isopropylmalate dehydrogenase [Deltaproteobacteria bacterium]MDP7157180.1 3-isopropylmalate dehydrogenase [SAR324 cluster bacterium]MDP7463342.1 3-isopropylmalate dehydrogenase [SAR324 cluster bacterium]